MKILKVITLVMLVLATSCKKDENSEAIESVVGHWHVLSYEPASSSEIALLTKDVVAILEERGCDPIEFTFKSDRTVSYVDRMSLISAAKSGEVTEVECVWEGGLKKGNFDFDYSKLTLNFDSETVIFNAAMEGEYLTLPVYDMILNGETTSGKLLFKRETGD